MKLNKKYKCLEIEKEDLDDNFGKGGWEYDYKKRTKVGLFFSMCRYRLCYDILFWAIGIYSGKRYTLEQLQDIARSLKAKKYTELKTMQDNLQK